MFRAKRIELLRKYFSNPCFPTFLKGGKGISIAPFRKENIQ
jgi:hypothetical protein